MYQRGVCRPGHVYRSSMRSSRRRRISRCSRARGSSITSALRRCLEAQFPDTRRDPARAAGAALYRGGLHGAGHSLLAAGRAAGARALGPSRSASSHLTTGPGRCSPPSPRPRRAPSRSWTCSWPWGPSLMATKGYAAPEVEQTYARARVLCTQVGETPQLFPTLRGLCRFYCNRGALRTARELGEQLWRLAQRDGRAHAPPGGP